MVKQVPQRTCVVCRRIAGKKELVRVVRSAGEGVLLDPGGRKAGRGAYLCLRPECLDVGLKGGKLEHALKVKMSDQERQRLAASAASLVGDGGPEG